MGKYDPNFTASKRTSVKHSPTRRRQMMIAELRPGKRPSTRLRKRLEIIQSMASHHLAILRSKGIVQARRDGANVYYSLVNPKIGEACDMVHEILMNQMARNKEFADRLMA